MPHDEGVTGDVPLNPAGPPEDDGPMVAEEVIARYVAESVRRVPGVIQLHGSALQELSEKVRMEVPHKGIAVREAAPGAIDIDIHVKVAWGVSIPRLAVKVQDEVTRTVDSLLDMSVNRVTLFVDEIGDPVAG